MENGQLPFMVEVKIQPERPSSKEFDVAISYAEEDIEQVSALVEVVKSLGIKFFYDQDEKSELWGKDLYTYLSDLYQNRARYCVMFLSKHYETKVWTNHEREAAQARAFKEHQEYILPIRLDDTAIPGISPTTYYLDWYQETPKSIAEAIQKKLIMLDLTKASTVSLPITTAPNAVVRASKKTKEQYLRAAGNALKKRHFEKALDLYSDALELDPRCAEAHNGKGDIYFSLGVYDKAHAAYKFAIRFNHELEIAHVGIAKALFHLDRYDETLSYYDKVIQMFPKCAAAHSGKGDLYFHLEEYNKALEFYEKSILYSNLFVDAYVGKGNVLRCLKRYQDALDAYEEALYLDNAYISALEGKANVFYLLGNFKDMCDVYDIILQLHPEPAAAYLKLGNLFAEANVHEAALLAYEKVIENEPTNISGWEGKANALRSLNRYEEAIEAFEHFSKPLHDNDNI